MSGWKFWIRPALEYVGTFEGRVSHEDGSSAYVCYHVLSQRGSRRFSEKVDGLGSRHSRHSVWAEAQVRAWRMGGPLPQGIEAQRSGAPEYRPKAELIVFPGGKA